MAKPPAFQFYVKDWRSSPTIAQMTRSEKGLYIDLMALAWDSDEPGTISLPLETCAKQLAILPKVLRKFLEKFPKVFSNVDGKLVQPKLAAQWLTYLELSRKRSEAAMAKHAIAEQKLYSASASASALKDSKNNTYSQDKLVYESHAPKPGAFVPPTIPEVSAYMKERGVPNADHQAELFVAHHQNRKWKLNSGRGATMKNWHLAVVTWQENIARFANNGNSRETKNEQAYRKTREAAERVRADL